VLQEQQTQVKDSTIWLKFLANSEPRAWRLNGALPMSNERRRLGIATRDVAQVQFGRAL
jgi:hypothetical protein